MSNRENFLQLGWRYPALKQAMTGVLHSLYQANDNTSARFFQRIAALKPKEVSISRLAVIYNKTCKQTRKPLVWLLQALRDNHLYCAEDQEAFYLIADDLIKEPSIMRYQYIRDAYSIVRLPNTCHSDKTRIWHIINVSNNALRRDLFNTSRQYYVGKYRPQRALIYSSIDLYVGDSYNSPADFPFEFIFILADKYLGTKDYYGIIAKMVELVHYFIKLHPEVEIPSNFPFTREILLNNRVQIAKFLQEQYRGWEDFYVAREGFSQRSERRFYCLHINNPSLAKIFRDYLISAYNTRLRNLDILHRFEESLGQYAEAIQTVADFSEQSFWAQIDFCKANYVEDGIPICDKPYTIIIDFYKWLLDTYPDNKIFERAERMSEVLIRSTRLPFWISNNYEFFSTENKDAVPIGKKAVLILKNFDQFETIDHHAFDLSAVKCSDYTTIIWKYFFSGEAGRRILHTGTYVLFFNRVLSIKLSGISGSINLSHISNSELSLVYADLQNQYPKVSSLNGEVSIIRSMLKWAREEGLLTLDSDFYNELPQRTPPPVEKKMASVDDVNKIVAFFHDKANNSLKWLHCLAILATILLTDLRPAEIFRLQVDNLVFNDDERSVRFIGLAKKETIHEKKDVFPGRMIYPIYRRLISDTEKLRREYPIQTWQNKVFIYKSHIDYTYVDNSIFIRALSLACESIGIPTIKPRDMRKTYMTFAYVEATKYPNWEYMLSVFDGHKTPMMSIEHYVAEDVALAKMINDISIEDKDTQPLMNEITIEAHKRLLS